MCGILGCMPAINNKEDFAYALNLLQHRGPDGAGIWSNIAKEITIGHRRLSILDLSEKGKQPFHFQYLSISFNGEIYNFIELRKQLKVLGYTFSTHTDTEVIIKAYHAWGHRCWPKFNGMWAIAIWNEQRKELVLSRDRFGQKPLFYCQKRDTNPDKFVFASEMKGIIPFLPKLELSRHFAWMQQHLFDYEPTEKCLIEGIKRFPAAHYGVWTQNTASLELYKYWETLEHIRRPPGTYKQQVAVFRELFFDACKIRMRSDVPVGTALSGGVDSTATICAMAHLAKHRPDANFTNNWQHAFVGAMPNTALDETKYAKKVTDYLGINAHFVPINARRGLKQLPNMLYQCEELYITSPVPMMQTYQAARQQGVYVTLDGHGADELFCGYDTFMLTTLKDCGFNPFAIKNLLNTYNALTGNNPQFKKSSKNFRDYFQQISHHRTFKKMLPHLPNEFTKIFKSYPKFTGRQIKKIDDLGYMNAALYRLFHSDNLPTLLRNYDRYAMAYGVEIRMPFLDHRVVSFLFSLPHSSKFRRGYTKILLRDALAPYCPQEVIYRKPKIGFQTPITDWLKNEWKTFTLDLIHSVDFQESTIINASNVKKQIETIIFEPTATYRQGELAYANLAPFLWYKYVWQAFKKIKKIDF